jgi:hypothetical protein
LLDEILIHNRPKSSLGFSCFKDDSKLSCATDSPRKFNTEKIGAEGLAILYGPQAYATQCLKRFEYEVIAKNGTCVSPSQGCNSIEVTSGPCFNAIKKLSKMNPEKYKNGLYLDNYCTVTQSTQKNFDDSFKETAFCAFQGAFAEELWQEIGTDVLQSGGLGATCSSDLKPTNGTEVVDYKYKTCSNPSSNTCNPIYNSTNMCKPEVGQVRGGEEQRTEDWI